MQTKHLEVAKDKIELLWLKGDDFTLEEISQAKKENKMLLLDMDFSDMCDLHCNYCDRVVDRFNKSDSKKKLTTEDRINLINQAKDLGARAVDFPGAGEPLLDKGFWEVIEHVSKCNMTPIVFSHGFHMNEDNIDRLYELGASIVLKYNTRNFERQDNIVGKKGYAERLEKVVELILKRGFTNTIPTRFAIDMIVSKAHNDSEEIEEIFKWCRLNNIHIYITSLIPEGLSDKKTKVLEREKAEKLLSFLQKIDEKEYGLKYESVLPLGGGYRCRKTDIGLFINLYGEVYECNGLSRFIGHTRVNSLKEIWQSKYAKYIRDNQKDGLCIVRERFWTDTDLSGFDRKMSEYNKWQKENGEDEIVSNGLKCI